MSKFLTISFFLLTGLCCNAQIVSIPDANFKTRLLEANTNNTIAYNGLTAIKIDSNNNNEIEVSEALQVTSLNVTIANIYDLTGIEAFTTLRSLNCTQNHIAAIDLSSLVNLKSLYCNLNLITALDLDGPTNLLNLECAENILTQINFAGTTSLQTLNCRFNFLTSLPINGLNNLISLNCDYNQLTTLDLSNLSQLTDLACQSNQLADLDLNAQVNLTSLNCSYNLLSALDLNNQNNLIDLNCSHNQITTLDITNLTQVSQLNCESNLINNALVFSGMPDLHSAYCQNNLIPSFFFADVPNLQTLDCSQNQISDLDVSSLPQLNVLNCHENQQLINLNIKNGSDEPFLYFSGNPNLLRICVDATQLAIVQNLINQYGYTNCQADSICDLALAESDLDNYFSVYPNPAKSYLHLHTSADTLMKSIIIYDILGQSVITIPDAENISTVNTSCLKTGIYFIKVMTDKGLVAKKFVKQP